MTKKVWNLWKTQNRPRIMPPTLAIHGDSSGFAGNNANIRMYLPIIVLNILRRRPAICMVGTMLERILSPVPKLGVIR